jgi:flagellar motility protein MotE (MotC chaperone)
VVFGIQAGKLEHREGTKWGNPYLKVLMSQLERPIAEKIGSSHLASTKAQTELLKVKKEIAELKKTLAALQSRKAEIEQSVGR